MPSCCDKTSKAMLEGGKTGGERPRGAGAARHADAREGSCGGAARTRSAGSSVASWNSAVEVEIVHRPVNARTTVRG